MGPDFSIDLAGRKFALALLNSCGGTEAQFRFPPSSAATIPVLPQIQNLYIPVIDCRRCEAWQQRLVCMGIHSSSRYQDLRIRSKFSRTSGIISLGSP